MSSIPVPTIELEGYRLKLQDNGDGTFSWTVTGGGGGGGSNPAAGPTGSPVPSNADYLGLNVGGTLRGATGVNPSGTIYALQSDLTSVNGVSIGSPSAYGTSPGAVNVIGVNAFVTSLPAITFSAPQHVIVDSGTIGVTQSTIPWVISNGGIFAVQATGTLTNNNAAPAANNIGALIALANVANPTFTEGDQTLVSVDLSGHLRVVVTGAAAAGSAIAGNPVLVAGSDGTNARTLLTDATGILTLPGQASAQIDGATNSPNTLTRTNGGGFLYFPGYPFAFNGSTWDRVRSGGVLGAPLAVPAPTTTAIAGLTPVAITSTAQAVLKASAGNLYGLSLVSLNVTTTSAGVLYVHFFNTTTTTALSTATWIGSLPIPAPNTASTSADLSIPPGSMALMNFSAGITIVVSTTSTSNTTAGGTGVVGTFFIK